MSQEPPLNKGNSGCRRRQFERQMLKKIPACHFIMVMVLLNGMKDMTVPIDQAGRIVLPKGVRQELAIKPGDRLKVSIRGLSVTLTPSHEATGLVRKGKALVFVTEDAETLSQEAAGRILEAGREEREEQITGGQAGRRRGQ